MLDAALKAQLRAYLEKITLPVELVAALDDSAASGELEALLGEIAGLSPMISLRADDGAAARRPSFAIRRADGGAEVAFAAIPLGHEFTSLVLALLQVGGHPPRIEAAIAEQIAGLEGEMAFETVFSRSCQNCPEVVQALNLMSVLNPRVRHVAIDGALFPDEVEARGVMAVPAVFLNGAPFAQGRMGVEDILGKLDAEGAAKRAAAMTRGKAPFDVLIVGGGPAGAAAAIYAARKGVRVGLAAERIGGQVLDTMGIENFIATPHTEGPRLAADLERHMRDYEMDLMTGARATRLVPAQTPGGLITVGLEGGGELTARSVILAPGAQWRRMNVPGEADYANRGVAYCPHCDGPLFKGRRVAVIGGGNSGAEAAIDLAGLASHVTLLEFGDRLRADAVLQRRLAGLSNVTVLTQARTTEVTGDGARVTGLTYEDRRTGELHRLGLDGIFVQIGLAPNTGWLAGGSELNAAGEIVIDAHNRTSLAGVFAAGDATTTPYKQIIVAAGEGSKAALGAFDHLMRLEDAPEPLARAA